MAFCVLIGDSSNPALYELPALSDILVECVPLTPVTTNALPVAGALIATPVPPLTANELDPAKPLIVNAVPDAGALIANPLARYVFVNGGVSSIGTGCTVNFINSNIVSSLGVSFFEQVATAQQNLAIYSWRGGLFSPQRLAYADLRLLTDSFLYVNFTGGANPAQPTTVQVQTGRFILESQNYAVPTAFPTGGQWVEGDRIYFLNVASSGYIGATCVTTGSPGSWAYFGLVL